MMIKVTVKNPNKHLQLGKQESLYIPTSSITSGTTKNMPHSSQHQSLNQYYLADTQSFLSSRNDAEGRKKAQSELKEEQVNIVSLNHWKSLGPKISKRQTYSQQCFSKLLNSGAVVQEDKPDNPKYPTPQINMLLIQTIFESESESKQQVQEVPSYDMVKEQQEQKLQKRLSQLKLLQKIDIETEAKQTQDILRKLANKKLINQIVLNKMSKNLNNNIDAKNATVEVLNSFKSLTAMFTSVRHLINYEDIYNQIIQQQKMPTSIVTKEFDRDLQRQQTNFDEIVTNKIKIIKDQSSEVESKKTLLRDLRVENCQYRDQIQSTLQRVDDMRKECYHQMSNALNDQKSDRRTSQLKYSNLRDNMDKENQKQATQLKQYRQDLDLNTQSIREQEYLFTQIQEQKNNSRQELAEFLKHLLKNEEIQIQDNLITVVKLLTLIKSNLSQADFPDYLDNQSRMYILNKSQAEGTLEDIKRQIKSMSTMSGVNLLGRAKLEQQNYLGNRPFHERKMKDIQKAFSVMKKENCMLKSSSDEAFKLFDVAAIPTSSRVKSPRQEGDSLWEVQELKIKLRAIEMQSEKMEVVEVNRLKALYQAKTMGPTQMSRLVKTVQAQFGAKRMKKVLQEVFDNRSQAPPQENVITSLIQLSDHPPKTEASSDLKQYYHHKSKQHKMRESFMNNPDINFLYDPTYNNIPTLQNKYMSSTFFPRNAM